MNYVQSQFCGTSNLEYLSNFPKSLYFQYVLSYDFPQTQFFQNEASLLVESGVPVTLLKTASSEETNHNSAAVHVTYVKPYHFDWEDQNEIGKINLKHFSYSTPFTEQGSAHGSIKTQQKRKTFLRVKNRLPFLIGKNFTLIDHTTISSTIRITGK